MRRLTRKICELEFDVYSPSYYRCDSLELFYTGLVSGWRLQSGDYVDPMPYQSKEAAMHRYLTAMMNVG